MLIVWNIWRRKELNQESKFWHGMNNVGIRRFLTKLFRWRNSFHHFIFHSRFKVQTLTSIGSTSWAMMTSWAFFCSTNLVTVLQPALKVGGFFFGASSFPATLASAFDLRRALFCNLVSGRYFSMSLKSWTAVCLSKAWENWLIGGGIFKRFWRMALWRWMRMYFGHLTKRERSRFGWTFWPKKEHYEIVNNMFNI